MRSVMMRKQDDMNDVQIVRNEVQVVKNELQFVKYCEKCYGEKTG